jgi:hypothetical protein
MSTRRPFEVRRRGSRRWTSYTTISEPLHLLRAGEIPAIFASGHLPGSVTLDSDRWPMVHDAGLATERWVELIEVNGVYLRQSTCATCNGPAEDCGHRADPVRDRSPA